MFNISLEYPSVECVLFEGKTVIKYFHFIPPTVKGFK